MQLYTIEITGRTRYIRIVRRRASLINAETFGWRIAEPGEWVKATAS
jgi:hypothetical protein